MRLWVQFKYFLSSKTFQWIDKTHLFIGMLNLFTSVLCPITDHQEPMIKNGTLSNQSLIGKLNQWQWWILVGLNIFFLIVGQAAAVLLGRFYYDQGGNSKWMATLVQTAAFPILLIPFFLIPSSKEPSNSSAPPSFKILASIYFSLGVLIAGDNMLYSVGLLYLSASTYSLICASQTAFNAVFSYLISSKKFTAFVLNSGCPLIFIFPACSQ